LSVSLRLVIFHTDNTYLLGTCPLGLVKKERPVCIATSWKAVKCPRSFLSLQNNLLQIIKYKLCYFYWFFKGEALFIILQITKWCINSRISFLLSVTTKKLFSIVFSSFFYHLSTVMSELSLTYKLNEFNNKS
jgi:hypothetical protein